MSRFDADAVVRKVDRELEKERRAERAKARAAKTRQHPRRKVLRIEGLFQVLECGHRMRPRSDMLREYSDAKSRYCEFCTKDAHPERYCRVPDCLSEPETGKFVDPEYAGFCIHHGGSTFSDWKWTPDGMVRKRP